MKLRCLLWIGILLFSLPAKGQTGVDSTSKRTTIFGLPIVYYTPETRWAFGAAGFLSWRFKQESDATRPSQIQLGGAYTLNDQILTYLSYRLWWGEERNTVFGELGWYRYNYYYFGIGNTEPTDYKELYGVNYPRIRVTYLRELAPNFYLGPRISADWFKITELDPEGQLINSGIPGTAGGLNSSVGIAFSYDTRDNVFESFAGWYAESNLNRYGKYVGSDFTYTRLELDIRKYVSVSQNDHFALDLYSEAIWGEAPFMSLALLGGNKRMRGLYEGRYRDNTSVILQAEYRRKIIGRLGAVLFGGVGLVGDSYSNLPLKYLRNTYGGGLRVAINKSDRINIRFDVGVGNREAAYYLTIGEAF